ncbi:hypothetical protein I8751_10310 [Nostocaceae cyanobacterium CENA357]|uniref:Uncharacterized protein n=1 Tax=Atlanticothrix silvestris CENA357 TaxID=1725252 RepID=A0A8J7HHP2_9CYAN|nr:hypothetical protein [Atlanticothrix silvestris]MBH8552756.1 hypothetical protein [Atlanticothrix silvestris CENA357]
MVDVRRLIDNVMFQPAKADGEINPKVTPLQNELEQERNESLTHRLADSKEIFISYAWGGESEQFVNNPVLSLSENNNRSNILKL